MRQGGNLDVCPATKEAWEERAKAKSRDCGGQSVYHCLSDNEGKKWERCVEKSLIKEGFCPIFSSKGFIDWKPCNISIPACPNSSYVSDEVYKYSHCFGNNSLHKQTDIDHNNADRVPVEAIIGVVLGFFLLLSAAMIAVWIIYFRRKPKNQNTIDEEDGLQMDLLSDRLENEIKKKVVSDDVKKIVIETIKETEIVTDQAERAEIKETCNKQVPDLREREKNVIIYQVKECQDKDGATRKKSDTDYVKSLAAFLEVEYKVVSVTRLGKRRDKTDSKDANEKPKPRPMKVEWTDIDSKRAFMKSLSRLKHVNENSPYFRIKISHDMTKEERDNDKKKYFEAKAKNDKNTSGKYRYIVRGPPWARRTVRVLK